MNKLGNILLALLLAVISITADGMAVEKARKCNRELQIAPSVGHQEFVLVKTVQLPDLNSESKPCWDIHPPTGDQGVRNQCSYGVSVPKSNTSFMSGRNCACIPLRL